MLNFELYNPTNYIFGKNQIENLDQFKPFYLKEFMVKKPATAH